MRARWLGLAMALAVLGGCQAAMAPAYDASLVVGIRAANVRAMELLATASGGVDRSTFASREAAYARVIGSFDALTIEAGARPVPDSRALERVNALLEKRGVPALDGEIPSVPALRKVSETVAKMRDTDRKQGVRDMEVQAFRGILVISIDQALTYERFLER